MKKVFLLAAFLLGCAAPTAMTLEEAKRIDKNLKNDDWKKDYVMICETFGGQRNCRYVSRMDMERHLRMLSM